MQSMQKKSEKLDFSQCLTADVNKLKKLVKSAKNNHNYNNDKLHKYYQNSIAEVQKREQLIPTINFFDNSIKNLPIIEKLDEIKTLIQQNQVIILCGETGSGKTTQLPKICLALGIGKRGIIAHTQPRRLAARSVANRLAQELNNSKVGENVALKIRFLEKVSDNKDSFPTFVKVMTDGVLLAETQSDPLLSNYEAIIIDEAHERSLNIDFLIGYLKQLQSMRPDLKIIITSATIDSEKFSKHFNNAPVIEVSGRLFPVEIRYLYNDENSISNENSSENSNENSNDDESNNLYDDIIAAIDEITLNPKYNFRNNFGDFLVFLPGENEIKEASKILNKISWKTFLQPQILPLYARLSNTEQDKIFKTTNQNSNKNSSKNSEFNFRIILSTNVAETSLTVPGIKYVIDSGLARIKRYSYKNKVEQLRIEKISQAAANQRAGRCGRVSNGVCIRLYSQQDFNLRQQFSDPEILRSSLAAVILRMKALKLSNIESFPFLDKPLPKAIYDGFQLLQELQALDAEKNLTSSGKILAKLPLDPKISKLLYAANQHSCLSEMLVIAAALSVPDPRESSLETSSKAEEKHNQIYNYSSEVNANSSEFINYLKLWNWFIQTLNNKGILYTNKQIKERFKSHFLSFLRLNEWKNVYLQLLNLVQELGWKFDNYNNTNDNSNNENLLLTLPIKNEKYIALHKSLLSGLIGNIGLKNDESGYYNGTRGIKFLIHPSTNNKHIKKRVGKWILAAEIVETNKLFARTIAKIEPEWVEEVAAHLIKTQYFEPHWEMNNMQVIAYSRSTLFGLIINNKKRISNYQKINLEECREIFIRKALVEGEVNDFYFQKWKFYQHNLKEIQAIENIEHKQRRQDVLIDDELIFQFYDKLLPNNIFNAASFDFWYQKNYQQQKDLLFFNRNDLMKHNAEGVTSHTFPPHLIINNIKYSLSYHFEPNSHKDGITISVPLELLNSLPLKQLDWLVPGLVKEKILALLKTLPQRLRSQLVPLPTFVDGFLNFINNADSNEIQKEKNKGIISALLYYIFQKENLNSRGKNVRNNNEYKILPESFRPELLSPHFFMNLRVIDTNGRQLVMGRNLEQIKQQWADSSKQKFKEKFDSYENSNDDNNNNANNIQNQIITSWSFGELPEIMEIKKGKNTLIGYPALSAENDNKTNKTLIFLKVFDSPEEAEVKHKKGLLELFKLQFAEQIKYFTKHLPDAQKLSLQLVQFNNSYHHQLKQNLDLNYFAEQIINKSILQTCLYEPLPKNENEFNARQQTAKQKLGLIIQQLTKLLIDILQLYNQQTKSLNNYKVWKSAYEDVLQQRQELFNANFFRDTNLERLQNYPRYLQAIDKRLQKIRENPKRDETSMKEIQKLQTDFQKELYIKQKTNPNFGALSDNFENFKWQLQELRVALFAQELKTPIPISVKRLQKVLENIKYNNY